ncbi:hypothetical protein XENTR_v10008701 [Xenopus tropicalis]|nr:hypothetical protein XENTR_v10008701 [Xenopus tropicalis]
MLLREKTDLCLQTTCSFLLEKGGSCITGAMQKLWLYIRKDGSEGHPHECCGIDLLGIRLVKHQLQSHRFSSIVKLYVCYKGTYSTSAV